MTRRITTFEQLLSRFSTRERRRQYHRDYYAINIEKRRRAARAVKWRRWARETLSEGPKA